MSNVSGTWITDAEATDPSYWAAHLRRTVRFAEGIGTLLADPSRLLLEVGPNVTLVAVCPPAPGKSADHDVLASLDGGKGRSCRNTPRFSSAPAASGCPAFRSLETASGGRRVSLPTYPFERTRHWVEPVRSGSPSQENTSSMPAPVLPVPALPVPALSAPSRVDRLFSRADRAAVGAVGHTDREYRARHDIS